MLEVEVDNKLPESWIAEVKQKVPHENTPYMLWDRADKSEVDLLANPEVAKKMIEYKNSLIKICEEKFLPPLTKR